MSHPKWIKHANQFEKASGLKLTENDKLIFRAGFVAGNNSRNKKGSNISWLDRQLERNVALGRAIVGK